MKARIKECLLCNITYFKLNRFIWCKVCVCIDIILMKVTLSRDFITRVKIQKVCQTIPLKNWKFSLSKALLNKKAKLSHHA